MANPTIKTFPAPDRQPIGNRWEVTFELDEVDDTGGYVKVPFVNFVDQIKSIECLEGDVVVRGVPNSQTDSQTEDDPGYIFVKTASGTHDATVVVKGH